MQEKALELLVPLIETPTINPPGYSCGIENLLMDFLRERGMVVHAVGDEKPIVIAEQVWGVGGPTLLFNGHWDVVPPGVNWKTDPFVAVRKGDRVYGRGTSDMKGGIVSILLALEGLKDLNGKIVVVFNGDEETMGELGLPRLDKDVLKADAAYISEPTDLKGVIAHKGLAWMRLETQGVSAHGARPHSGVNAIEMMMDLVSYLRANGNFLTEGITHPTLDGPTANIGLINGGVKINMVPDRCILEVDRRLIPGEKAQEIISGIEGQIREWNSKHVAAVSEIVIREPFSISSDVKCVKLLQQASTEVIGQGELTVKPGTTDASLLMNHFGIPTVVYGPGEPNMGHKVDEWVSLEKIIQCGDVFRNLINRWMG